MPETAVKRHTPRLDAGREVCLACPVLLAGDRYGTADWPCVICAEAQCLWQRIERVLDTRSTPASAACRERIKEAIIVGDHRRVIEQLLIVLESGC